MQQLLTGRLKADGTPRTDSEFKPDEHFSRLPRDWQSARVKHLIASCEYGLSRAMSARGQYPIFRMNNIERGRMVAAPLAYIDLSPEDFASYRVRKGDILFNRTNSLDLVGKVGIFALEGDFVFASYLVRLVANKENDPRFLNYYLNSFEGQKRIATKVTPSIGQANVNTSSLRSVWAVKPPRDEQSAIADRLDAFFDLINAKEQKIAALQRLKKSLMQNLLTGHVRLPMGGTGKKETKK
jgi:type I restriction enzyme S subunit